ncbi:MAG: leucine-rich repeat domain-containing protein, partial [Spirochaetales bacterium]|nr:leucine-rich repeat domain-containing protein [Spirochaetales bacterium]
ANVTIQNGSTRIPDYMFQSCDGITGITIPETVTTIGQYTFYECTADISMTLPASLGWINTTAFWYCTCDIVFASGTTNIPRYVLYRSNIRHITIPVSITSLYKSSFESCNLYSITYEGTQEQWAAVTKESGWEGGLSDDCVIHCTDGDVTP